MIMEHQPSPVDSMLMLESCLLSMKTHFFPAPKLVKLYEGCPGVRHDLHGTAPRDPN